MRSNADAVPNAKGPAGLTAVDLDEADLETDADLENFDDLDADDADLVDEVDLQVALADEDLDEAESSPMSPR